MDIDTKEKVMKIIIVVHCATPERNCQVMGSVGVGSIAGSSNGRKTESPFRQLIRYLYHSSQRQFDNAACSMVGYTYRACKTMAVANSATSGIIEGKFVTAG